MQDFIDGTRQAFGFLRQLGFREVIAESLGPRAGQVRLESKNGAVEVWHDPRCEIDVYVECSGDTRKIALDEILSFVQAPDATRYGCIYSSDKEHVGSVLERLADGLKRYGGPWLACDHTARKELLAFSGVGNALMTQYYSRHDRPGTKSLRVRQAWAAQDFPKVIALIARLDKPLTTAEQLALDYATQRAGASKMQR
jgi:hypothetical protein